MKYLALLPFVFLVSCWTIKYTPLKGKYFGPPFTIITPTSKDQVWDKLIDLFAQKGLSIKIIDKSSGLIISEKTRMSWTNEKKNGELLNKDAFIAVPLKTYNGETMRYTGITAEWNVRIKSQEDGKTVININVVNIMEEGSELTKYQPVSVPMARSTGVFENIIVEYIK